MKELNYIEYTIISNEEVTIFTPTVANDELVVYVNDYHGYFLLSEVEKAN